MNYSTVVAPPSDQNVLGYPAKMFPYYVEIDEEGNVSKHGFLEEVLGTSIRSTFGSNESPQATGSVLAIDEEHGFAVISLGEQDGARGEPNCSCDAATAKRFAQLRLLTRHKKPLRRRDHQSQRSARHQAGRQSGLVHVSGKSVNRPECRESTTEIRMPPQVDGIRSISVTNCRCHF